MLRRATILTAILMLIALVPGGQGDLEAGTPITGFKEGQWYPDFYLPDTDGMMGTLSQFRGQKTLLITFATWSPSCIDVLPEWVEKIEELKMMSSFHVVGLVQEQHGDRAALFKQWHQLDWTIFVDTINVTGQTKVPQIWGLDTNGVIKMKQMRPNHLASFLTIQPSSPFTRDDFEYNTAREPVMRVLERAAKSKKVASAWIPLGDAHYFKGEYDKAIEFYIEANTAQETAKGFFRLGCAYFKRSESDAAKSSDRKQAIAAWAEAMIMEEKHEVRQARLDEYGPPTDKPTFDYSWIKTAREEITARGEEAQSLKVDPPMPEKKDAEE